MYRSSHRRARPLITSLVAALLTLPAACATARQPSTTMVRQLGALSDAPRADRPSDLISGADLLSVGASNTAEAVRRLRPNFVRPNAVIGSLDATATPTVYIDGRYLGGMDVLDRVLVEEVDEIEFIRPNVAKNWWGAACRCAAGVIHVRTKHAR